MKTSYRLWAALTLIIVTLPCFADDKLAGLRPALSSAEQALQRVDPLVLDIRYVSGKAMSETLDRSRRVTDSATKLLSLHPGRSLTLSDEFLLFHLINSLAENMVSLSESLRNVDGAFGDRGPNNLAGQWNGPVQTSVEMLHKAAFAIEDNLNARLEDADKCLAREKSRK